jgi:crossover junction endodeoxyribonuclease RusA
MSKPLVSLTLTLPLPPGVNNQYVTVGNRRVLSKAAQAFKRDVGKLVARLRETGDLPPETEDAFREAFLGVYLTFHFETPNRRDLDGGLKIALDALCRALGLDDRAVVDLHLTKRIDPLHPHLDVELEAIPEWEFDRTYIYLGETGAADGPPPAPPILGGDDGGHGL